MSRMSFSLQDWFFRVEFVMGTSADDTIAETIDDGLACEDHVIVVDGRKLNAKQFEAVLRHEFEHALYRFMQRHTWRITSDVVVNDLLREDKDAP